jgi:hypothetical protein
LLSIAGVAFLVPPSISVIRLGATSFGLGQAGLLARIPHCGRLMVEGDFGGFLAVMKLF